MPPKPDPALDELMKKLNGIDNKIDNQTTRLDELKESHDEVLELIKNSSQCIDEVEAETQDLRATVGETNNNVEELRQLLLRNTIEIVGVPVVEGEDVLNVVTLILSQLKINISKTDINRAYRLGKKIRTNERGQQFYPSIIVDFAREHCKNILFDSVKRRESPLTTDKLNGGFDCSSTIYFNEFLTPHNRRIYLAARRAKKSGPKMVTYLAEGMKVRRF